MFNTLSSIVLPLILAILAFGGNTPPVVTNVTAAQQGECSEVVFTYDLADADGDACTVWLAVSADGGANFSVPLLSISGDFGDGILPGLDKMVLWDVVQDAPGIEGSDFVVRVYADDGNSTGPMVFVPPGNFQMGQIGVAEPVHPVTLSAYWIDKLEVSVLQYAGFLNAGGNDDHWDQSQDIIRTSDGQGGYIYSIIEGYGPLAMSEVNYDDATEFCEWRGLMEGEMLTLPTEAQWECAAGWNPVSQDHWVYGDQSNVLSGDSINYFASGDPWEAGGSPSITPAGFYDGTVQQKTDWDWPSNQSSFATNDARSFFGARDMSGNVAEWCFDFFHVNYYQQYIDAGSPPDPSGPTNGSQRVQRGGHWGQGEDSDSRTAHRWQGNPDFRDNSVGFRCAKMAP